MTKRERAQRCFARRLVWLAAASLVLHCGKTSDGSRNPVRARSNILIGPAEVCMPVDAWLLLRSNHRICAVKIDDVWMARDATHARVETAVLVDGRWRREMLEVAEYPLVGPHPFSFQRGNVEISCRSFTVEYSRPSCIGLYAHGHDRQQDRIEAAPSAWMNLEQVNPKDRGLTWHTADDNRVMELELSRVPGSR